MFHVNSNKRKKIRKKLKAIMGIYEILAVFPEKRSQSLIISFGVQNFIGEQKL